MFAPSNDWYVALPEGGVALFDEGGAPQAVTAELALFDAGSEIDQLRGFGLDQVHMQADVDQGEADPDANLRAQDCPLPLADLFEVRVIPGG